LEKNAFLGEPLTEQTNHKFVSPVSASQEDIEFFNR